MSELRRALAPAILGQLPWRDRAACRGHDPEKWFSEPGSDEHEEALEICARCPVLEPCRDAAQDECEGIWGGLWRERGHRRNRVTDGRCGRCGGIFVATMETLAKVCGPCLSEAERATIRRKLERRKERKRKYQGSYTTKYSNGEVPTPWVCGGCGYGFVTSQGLGTHQARTRCGVEEQVTLDHVWPFSLGGSDDPDDLQTLCKSCNSRKGTKDA